MSEEKSIEMEKGQTEKLIELIEIGKIEPNDYNPNEMTDAEFEECKNEIKHLGTIPKPIVVREVKGKFIIIDGEHNWRAAKELGFITVPCEIIKVNDNEAMRQTYKRNMHGKFNQVKLGEMFKKAGAGTADVSLRELAEKYNISDGTVRNALAYFKAQELRNSYAFENDLTEKIDIKDLSIRQIRAYIALPPVIRDKWLLAGADLKFLVPSPDKKQWEHATGKWFDDSDVEEYEKWVYPEASKKGFFVFRHLDEIYKAGLVDKIKADKWEFQSSVEKAEDFLHWERWNFCGSDDKFWEKVRPYTILYYDIKFENKEQKKLFRDDFKELYRLICLGGEFRITAEEFAKIIKDSKSFGCEGGRTYLYPQRHYIKQAMQVLLIEKGIIKEPVDLETLPDPAMKLVKFELERNAPDFIKTSKLPTELKIIIFEFKPYAPRDTTEAEYVEALDVVKRLAITTYEEKYRSDNPPRFVPQKETLEDTFADWFKELVYRNKIAAMTNENIVVKIISMTNLYSEGPGGMGAGTFEIEIVNKVYDEETRKVKLSEFKENLMRMDRAELLAIYEIMDYQNFCNARRQELRAAFNAIDGGKR
jgi:ParB/RepB/Spo0J family partition protein